MIKLEQYFTSEKDWVQFSKPFSDHWVGNESQLSLLIHSNNQSDLAEVIYFYFQENWEVWINKKIPALDGMTPLECIQKKELNTRLKVYLMRMK